MKQKLLLGSLLLLTLLASPAGSASVAKATQQLAMLEYEPAADPTLFGQTVYVRNLSSRTIVVTVRQEWFDQNGRSQGQTDAYCLLPGDRAKVGNTKQINSGPFTYQITATRSVR